MRIGKGKAKMLQKVEKIMSLNCSVKRCKTCGTPNWDGGLVCGNCDANPDEKPEASLPFDPFFNQYIR